MPPISLDAIITRDPGEGNHSMHICLRPSLSAETRTKIRHAAPTICLSVSRKVGIPCRLLRGERSPICSTPTHPPRPPRTRAQRTRGRKVSRRIIWESLESFSPWLALSMAVWCMPAPQINLHHSSRTLGHFCFVFLSPICKYQTGLVFPLIMCIFLWQGQRMGWKTLCRLVWQLFSASFATQCVWCHGDLLWAPECAWHCRLKRHELKIQSRVSLLASALFSNKHPLFRGTELQDSRNARLFPQRYLHNVFFCNLVCSAFWVSVLIMPNTRYLQRMPFLKLSSRSLSLSLSAAHAWTAC